MRAIDRRRTMQRLKGSSTEQEMTGGCLGQVHRGRAQGLQRVKRVRAAVVLWTGLWMIAGVAGAQEVPDAPEPAQAALVAQSGAAAVTPAQTTPPVAGQAA